MTFKFVVISVALWVGVLAGVAVYAADEGTVTATVTAQNISVSVNDGSITYGTIALNGSQTTLAAGVDDMQFASNTGNITEDLNIRGADTAAWTLTSADPTGEQYSHEFSTNRGVNFLYLTTSNRALVDAITTAVSQQFDLRITMSNNTATFTQQSAGVTVQATAN